MSLSERTFKVGDIVFAKVRGFAPWPAIVNKIKKNTAEVTFSSKRKET